MNILISKNKVLTSIGRIIFQNKLRNLGKTNHVCNFSSTQKLFQEKMIDMNTKVSKDVILFHYENPKFYKYLNIFAITQLFVFLFCGHTCYTSLKDVPVENPDDPNSAWWQKINLGEKKYRIGLGAMSYICGGVIFCLSWLYTLRTVRYLILNKGGQKLSFVLYTPFGENRILTVPLQNVSCLRGRTAGGVQIPIKIQGKIFNYVLDMKGDFRHPQLFDYTAGIKRKFV